MNLLKTITGILLILLINVTCDKETEDDISYQNEGKWGKNIINVIDTMFIVNNYYSMSAFIPSGAKVTVKHSGNYSGALGYPLGQDNTGWDDIGTDESMIWRTYKTNRSGNVDLKVFLTDTVTIYIFENDDEMPTRIKKIYKSE